MPSAVSETGRKLRDLPVETNGQAFVDAVQTIPGHKHRGFEEDLQSAWLHETLSIVAPAKRLVRENSALPSLHR
jgi:hypothetical protein